MTWTRPLNAATLVGAAAGAAYVVSHRPWASSGGATPREIVAVMPGDEIVGQARYRTTHALTIHTPPADVWPWLVQLGQGRGGLYSYDWLENLVGCDIHSLDHVDPSLQDLAVGDPVRMVPEGTQPPLCFRVARLEAPHVLVLGPDGSREEAFAAGLSYPCWTFALTPVGSGACRLVVRFQSDFVPTLGGRFMYSLALRPVHAVMEHRMMRGIKERAECSTDRAPHLSVSPAPSPAVS